MSDNGLIDKVFLGANGIDIREGYCAHTAGHLLVAELAKRNDIPVYVFADSLKFYSLRKEPFQYPPRQNRNNYWFCSRKELDKREVELAEKITNFGKFRIENMGKILDTISYNRQEDIVKKDLVTLFITDMGIAPPEKLDRLLKEIHNIVAELIS